MGGAGDAEPPAGGRAGRQQRRALGDDNWGNWEIEDATIYHGVWLYALLGYADALGKLDELFRTPEVYYYAHYFLNLMSPAGMVPDFGDAAWTQNWQHFFVFFEAAAARLNDPTMEWAAQQIAARSSTSRRPTSVGLGCFLLDAYRWGRADIAPARADEPERRGHGGRAGQEDRVPQRLEARLDLPAAELPRRGRRRA